MSRLNLLIPPPVIVVLTGAAMWLVDESTATARLAFPFQQTIALGLLAGGLLLIGIAAIQLFAARTTINPLQPARASRLMTNGVYGISRNPIYLGDWLLLAAWAVWLGNALNAVPLVLFIGYISRFQIAPEEHALSQIFGERYATYCSRVRRWL